MAVDEGPSLPELARRLEALAGRTRRALEDSRRARRELGDTRLAHHVNALAEHTREAVGVTRYVREAAAQTRQRLDSTSATPGEEGSGVEG